MEDVADRSFTHSEASGDVALIYRASKRSNLANFVFNQPGLRASFSSKVGIVDGFVCYVLSMGLPRKMALCDTSKVPLSARVSSFVLWGWRRAVDVLAQATAHDFVGARL
jgi:hypothetical protein